MAANRSFRVVVYEWRDAGPRRWGKLVQSTHLHGSRQALFGCGAKMPD
jgi:hypothetical protein